MHMHIYYEYITKLVYSILDKQHTTVAGYNMQHTSRNYY